MKTITKTELTKALGHKKLARIYCKGYTPEQVEDKMQRYPRPEEMDKIYQIKQVRTNDIIIVDTIEKLDYVCSTNHSRFTEIEFQGRKGYTIEFLNKDTKEPYSCVLYVA